MLLKTIAFIVVLYLLVKFISRLFLPGSGQKKSNARVFYQAFKNVREQQKRHEQQQRNRSGSRGQGRFDDVEEAEFEEITEPKETDKE